MTPGGSLQMHQEPAKEDRSIGELFTELASETSTLVRQEIELARVEVTQKIATLTSNIVWIAAGGVLALLGIMALTAALVAGLSKFMDVWVAALLTAALYLLPAGVVIWSGLRGLKNTDLAPRQTVETLKEDTQWLKKQIG
jgi:uncharacterized membrane protein YqjE